MLGILDRLNQPFANAGRPDLVRSSQGFLDGLSAHMDQGNGQPMQLAPPGQVPAEARVGQARAPGQGGGWLDNLSNSISDNQGMLMNMGAGLLENGWAGAGRAMGGMQQDQARRAQEAQEAQAEAQRQAQLQLGQQHGIDPLLFEAGMGQEALTQAMRPAPAPDPFTLSEGQIRYDGQGNEIARGGEDPGAAQEAETARMDGVANYQTALDGIELIDSVISDPALPGITGALQGPMQENFGFAIDVPWFNGVDAQDRADLQAKLSQLQGEAFLQGFDRLRGGGQITEAEGRQARNAVARLQQSQSTEAYQQSLRELQTIMERGALRAQGLEPTDQNLTIFRAQRALQGGAEPQAVAQRLQEAGIDPNQTGIFQ